MAALHAADEATIIRELDAMGVECIEPASEREHATAALMEAFAAFVLEEQPRQSLAILERNHDGSVGELQGGGEHAIYRVEITDDEESVVSRLLRAHGHGLTVERIRRHMLTRGVDRLDNFMLLTKSKHKPTQEAAVRLLHNLSSCEKEQQQKLVEKGIVWRMKSVQRSAGASEMARFTASTALKGNLKLQAAAIMIQSMIRGRIQRKLALEKAGKRKQQQSLRKN